MPSNSTHVCIPCRLAFKDTYKCPSCGEAMRSMGKHWRAPKRTNDHAWKLIAKGVAWWDKRHRESRIKRAPGRYRNMKAVPNRNGKGRRGYEYDYDMEGRELLKRR